MSAVLFTILLNNYGCEKKREVVSKTADISDAAVLEPALPVILISDTNTQKPEVVKIEQTAEAEPNKTISEPAVEIKITEPNKQEIEKIKEDASKSDNINKAISISSPKNDVNQLFEKCTEFLARYVNSDGMVDYKTLSRKKMELSKILEQFRILDRSEYTTWSNNDKLAFWINAYNIELVKIIQDNYPIESNRMLRLIWPPNSIRHIKGIWDERKFIIMDEEFTLKEIERRFFLIEPSEPSVFFGIYYASISGPPLRNEAYRGENLSSQLDSQVKTYIAGSNALKIDRENGIVYLSSIFNPTWYGNQFIPKYGTNFKFKQQETSVRAVLNFLTKYISPQEINYLETGNYTVEYMRYDWTLNEIGG